MRETTVIDSVSASIEWTLTADKVCFPEVWVDAAMSLLETKSVLPAAWLMKLTQKLAELNVA